METNNDFWSRLKEEHVHQSIFGQYWIKSFTCWWKMHQVQTSNAYFVFWTLFLWYRSYPKCVSFFSIKFTKCNLCILLWTVFCSVYTKFCCVLCSVLSTLNFRSCPSTSKLDPFWDPKWPLSKEEPEMGQKKSYFDRDSKSNASQKAWTILL